MVRKIDLLIIYKHCKLLIMTEFIEKNKFGNQNDNITCFVNFCIDQIKKNKECDNPPPTRTLSMNEIDNAKNELYNEGEWTIAKEWWSSKTVSVIFIGPENKLYQFDYCHDNPPMELYWVEVL